MEETVEQRTYSYRWVVLFIIFLTHITINVSIFQIGGLANRLIPSLGIEASQLAMILSVPMLTAAIFGVPAGSLADRFGVKNIVTIGLILSTIGSFGRVSSDSFAILFAWMFVIGFGLAFLNANAAKILGAWFPSKQMGMAMGIYVAGAGTGITIALATSALFQSIHSAFMTSAVMNICTAILWLVFVKSQPEGVSNPPLQPFIKYLGVATKSKNVWFGALAMFFMMGTMVTHTGFLSNALTEVKGVDPVLAGLVASTLTLAGIAGMVFGPIISTKVGLIKPFLAPVACLGAIMAYLSWNVPFGAFTWIFLMLTGFFINVPVPLIMSLPMMLPEIGPVYAGSAGGIISTLQMTGAFIISSYIILPLAGSNIDLVFLYISIGYFIFGLITLLLPELGAKAKSKKGQ
jgi:sugar phosphate permease